MHLHIASTCMRCSRATVRHGFRETDDLLHNAFKSLEKASQLCIAIQFGISQRTFVLWTRHVVYGQRELLALRERQAMYVGHLPAVLVPCYRSWQAKENSPAREG